LKKLYHILILLFLFANQNFAQKEITIHGTISGPKGEKIANTTIYFPKDIRNSTHSLKNGKYTIKLHYNKPIILIFNNVSYEQKRITIHEKLLKKAKNNVLKLDVKLKYGELKTIVVFADKKPDTVFGSKTSSISDFEFYEDKLVLLSYEGKFKKKWKLQLTGTSNELISEYYTPKKPKRLFKDYEGKIYLITEFEVYLITVFKKEFRLRPIDKKQFYRFTTRIVDTVKNHFLYSDFSENYPGFSYYAQHKNDTISKKIHYTENKFMMELYRAEFKYVSGREKLWAFRQEMRTGIDKEIWIGAKNFTQSLYYEPLYAPLFVKEDTILIFDHYSDLLFKIDTDFNKIDSIPIKYHKGKNKKNWEEPILKDKEEQKLYALFLKNGYYYLKYINLNNGEIENAFKLNYRYAENVKVKNGYVYYIYRPFESLQRKFLYREIIKQE